jgi:hypothetical protein
MQPDSNIESGRETQSEVISRNDLYDVFEVEAEAETDIDVEADAEPDRLVKVKVKVKVNVRLEKIKTYDRYNPDDERSYVMDQITLTIEWPFCTLVLKEYKPGQRYTTGGTGGTSLAVTIPQDIWSKIDKMVLDALDESPAQVMDKLALVELLDIIRDEDWILSTVESGVPTVNMCGRVPVIYLHDSFWTLRDKSIPLNYLMRRLGSDDVGDIIRELIYKMAERSGNWSVNIDGDTVTVPECTLVDVEETGVYVGPKQIWYPRSSL